VVVRNSIDARAVTEEFRERLRTMRTGRTIVDGNDVAAAAAAQGKPGSDRR